MKHNGMLLYHFRRWKYPDKVLQNAFDRAFRQSKESLLHVDDEVSESIVAPEISVLLTKYYPNFDPITKMVKRNWGILKRSSTTKELSKSRLIVGYRRTKNLRDILVNAKIKTRETSGETFTGKPLCETTNKCIRKTCKYCTALDTTGRITSMYTKREYAAKKAVTCKSSNLIYCITCKVYQKQYVGQTYKRLMDQFGGH